MEPIQIVSDIEVAAGMLGRLAKPLTDHPGTESGAAAMAGQDRLQTDAAQALYRAIKGKEGKELLEICYQLTGSIGRAAVAAA